MPSWKKVIISGSDAALHSLTVTNGITANSFKTPSGTSTQFLMADGSTNSNTYAKTDGTNAAGTWGINTTGNAATATTLQTARNINGTSFNGSADITTATWGTSRTITVGNTGKSVNGSGNVSWTLAEIGAQAALTNPITGTATSGQVAFFNGTTTQTGDTNLFWDNTNKRLGIGTTAPFERLDVGGNVRISQTLTGGGYAPSGTSYSQYGISGGTGTDGRFYFDSRSDIDNGGFGKVVLSASPEDGLFFSTNNLDNSKSSYLAINPYSSTLASGGDIAFITNPFTSYQTRLIIRNDGNVGIGATTPSEKLDVNGNVRANSFIRLGGTPSQFLMADGSVSTLTNPITGTGTVNYIPKFTASGTIGNSLIFDNGINVGIGTSSPEYKLDVGGIVNVNATPGPYGTLIRLRDTVSLGTESFGGVHFTSSPGTDYIIGKWSTAAGAGLLQIRDQSGNALMTINGGGNVGIGTTTLSSYKLNVNGDTNINGTLTATVKSFIIDHPTKPNKKLQYGVLEGPEHSVYVRGKLTNNNIITLPDHWHALVHEDTITVNLTPIGKKQDLWVETVSDTAIKVGSDSDINCFYTVFAERKDIEKLVTEFDKE